MLNTADDPIDFLKNEAADAGEDVIIAIHAPEAMFTSPTDWWIFYRARRAWRFALAAQTLDDHRTRRPCLYCDACFACEDVGTWRVANARGQYLMACDLHRLDAHHRLS